MGFFQEGSESFPAETALKNSCNVKLATSKKQSGTCIPKETHKKEKTWGRGALVLCRPQCCLFWGSGLIRASLLLALSFYSPKNPLLSHQIQTLKWWYPWDSPGKKHIRDTPFVGEVDSTNCDAFSKWETLTPIEIKSVVQRRFLVFSSLVPNVESHAPKFTTVVPHPTMFWGWIQKTWNHSCFQSQARGGGELKHMLQDLTQTGTINDGESHRSSKSSLACLLSCQMTTPRGKIWQPCPIHMPWCHKPQKEGLGFQTYSDKTSDRRQQFFPLLGTPESSEKGKEREV